MVISPREKQVLNLAAEGYTNKEIGRMLNTSMETVKDQIRSILYKLEARNRTAAVAKAIKLGLLE